MNKKLLTFFVLILLSLSVIADDFEDAERVYISGDYSTAFILLKKPAEQGCAWAQNNLGWLYHQGLGVTQDYMQAVYWYEKSAEQGNEASQSNLGGMYYHGLGVTPDYIEAYKWHSIASANGVEKSRDAKDSIVKLMTPSQIESAQKLAREWMKNHQQ